MTINREKIQFFKKYLDRIFPNARCALNYQKDYELVMAVVLSAQTTDQAVNKVTPQLFSHFDSLEKIKNAPLSEIERGIRAIGLFRNKANHIKKIATILLDEFDGIVPSDSSQLLSLPGVGNKTRNVIQAELFNIPSIAVDTHVQRISKRLGFALNKDNPDQIEKKLKKLLLPEHYIKMNHQIISFGRQICHARNPKCSACDMKAFCKYFNSKLKV